MVLETTILPKTWAEIAEQRSEQTVGSGQHRAAEADNTRQWMAQSTSSSFSKVRQSSETATPLRVWHREVVKPERERARACKQQPTQGCWCGPPYPAIKEKSCQLDQVVKPPEQPRQHCPSRILGLLQPTTNHEWGAGEEGSEQNTSVTANGQRRMNLGLLLRHPVGWQSYSIEFVNCWFSQIHSVMFLPNKFLFVITPGLSICEWRKIANQGNAQAGLYSFTGFRVGVWICVS